MLKKLIIVFNIVAIVIVGVSILNDIEFFRFIYTGDSDITINRYDADITLSNDGTMIVSELWEMQYPDGYSTRFRDIEYDKFSLDYPLPYSQDNQAIFDTSTYSFTLREEEGITPEYFLAKGTSFNGDIDELGEKVVCPKESSDLCESFFMHTILGQFDEDTVFEYNYQIHDVVTEYSDVQEYNWVLFSYAESMINDGSVVITLPNSVNNIEDIEVFTPSIRDARVLIENDKITIDFTELLTNQELAFRILVPTTTFTNLNQSSIFIDEGINKSIIVDYENSVAADSKGINLMNLYINISSIVLANTILFFGLLSFKLHLNDYKFNLNKSYYKSPPSDHSPATIGYIINNSSFKGIEVVSATLLDLIYKGYLSVEDLDNYDEGNDDFKNGTREESAPIEGHSENLGSLRNASLKISLNKEMDLSKLNIYEKHLIDWYIHSIGNGESVSMEMISRNADNMDTSQSYLNNSTKFNTNVKTEVYRERIFDKNLKKGKRKVYYTLFASVIAIAVEVFLSIQYETVLFIPFFLIVVASLFLVIAISKYNRKSEKWEKLSQEWICYKENLEEMNVLTSAEVIDVEYFDYHLIYATLFGIADMVLDKLATNVNTNEMNMKPVSNDYLYYRMCHRTLHNEHSRNIGIARRQVKILKASMSSSSHSSGGFSGGSFGGGGGGGRSR